MLSNKGRHDTTKLGSSVVQEFKINQRRILIDSLEIGIPAPEQMIALGERQLPSGVKVGQLLNSKTLNYKKFTPHRDGLFCERIFGPVQSFVCACGKKKESVQNKSRQKDIVRANLLPPPPKAELHQNERYTRSPNNVPVTVQTEVLFCPKCQVEYISKNVRRHRLGHIKLFAPVTHIWYLKGRPSYLSLFLGKRKKAMTSLAYCNAYLVEQVYSDLETQNLLKNTDKSVNALVKKSSATMWQNTGSNDLNGKGDKDKTAKDLEESLFLTLEDFSKAEHLDLPLPNKPSEKFSFDYMNNGKYRSHKKNLYKTKTDFKNQDQFTNSSGESFLSLLTQLFPQTLTPSLQTNSKDVPERLLKAVTTGFETKLKQSKYCYPVFIRPSFAKQTRGEGININRMTNLKNRSIRQDVPISKLATKRLRYKVSTNLEGVKYFVETAWKTTKQSFGNTDLLSIGRGQSKISPIPYIRAQALPFLPSLICPFHLRDCLISFLQSLPCAEDIPIPIYCQTPRRYPLRDVHKFLAEVRSTNTQDQTERLTSESITRFIGLSKRALKSARTVTRPYSGTVKISSAYSNQRNSKGNGAFTKLNVTKPRYTGTGMSTKRLQKQSGYLQNQNSFTPPSLLRNEHRYIVVHKPHHANLFSQIKVDLFASLNSEDNNSAFSVLNKGKQSPAFSNKGNSRNQPRVISKNKWDKKRVFVGTQARTTKRIFTLNGLDIGKDNNKARHNQRVQHFSPIQLNKNGNKVIPKSSFDTGRDSFVSKAQNQNKALFARVPERQTRVHKALSKQALVPLGLNFLTSSSFIRNSFVTPYKKSCRALLKRSYTKTKYCKKDVLGLAPVTPAYQSRNLLLDKKRPKNEGLYREWSSASFSTPPQLAMQEIKLSLRGVLLSTVFNTIRAGLTELSLPLSVRQLEINGIKQVGFRLQRKQTVTSPNSEKTITNNKVVLTSKMPELLAKHNSVPLQIPAKPELVLAPKTSFGYVCEALLDKPGLFSFKKKKEFKYEYKIKKLTYLYVPTLLYARQLHFDKNRVNLTGILSGLPELRYRYRFGLAVNLPSKTSAKARSCNASEAVILHPLLFQGQYQNLLNKNLQNLLFRKRHIKPTPKSSYTKSGLCLSKAKLWCNSGLLQSEAKPKRSYALPKLMPKLRYAKTKFWQRNCFVCTYARMYGMSFAIDTYQARLLHIVFGILQKSISLKRLPRYRNEVSSKLGFSSATTNFSFLHNTKLETGCTYLLTTNQQEQRQGQVYKNKNTAKVECNGVQTFVNNSSANLDKVQQDFGVRGQVFVQGSAKPKRTSALPKQSFGTTEFRYKAKLCTPEQVMAPKTSFLHGTYRPEFGSGVPKQSFGSNSNGKTKPSFVTPTPFGSEAISKWHINGAKEILLYTGGGALESLLKRFNISLFCQFLLGEVQILRKHYKDQVVAEYNTDQIVAEHSFDSLNQDKLWSYKNGLTLKQSSTETGNSRVQEKNSYLQSHDWLVRQNFVSTRNKALLSSSKIATEHTLDHKEQDLGLQYVVSDKSANLFCRRIYRTTRRLKIVQLLMTSKRRPEWMMISVLPVLPPDLRPVLQMGDNLIVASDLNTLYQRVIYRNNRHYKGRFLDFHFVSSIHRLVQDAVDRLIENGKGGSTPFLTPGGRPLLSLSDILKGKRGRFRFNLLGKRVDFSGRSVIVVDPNLKIHECGLPREMALELYKYLLIRQLLLQKRASSIVNAKRLIKQRKPFIWDILRQIIYYHPLLLNRAPTLHRLGIQAFQPKLVLGNAILLHPLVCAGFNADFDGDQMGVHLPLSPQARAEAWDLLWSRNNLLSPATGQPILLPSQDMVLGFYYMTSLLPYGTTNKTSLSYQSSKANAKTSFCLAKTKFWEEEIKTSTPAFDNLLPEHQPKRLLSKPSFITSNLGLGFSAKSLVRGPYNFGSSNQRYKNKIDELVVHVFSDKFQVVHAYQNKQIDIHTPIWYKWVGKSENGEKSQVPVEIRIDTFGDRTQIYSTHQSKNKICKGVNTCFFSCHIRTTVGRVLVNNLINKKY